MKRGLRSIPMLLIATAIVALLTFGFWPRPIRVDVVEATLGPLTVTVNEDGRTRIREKYVVLAPVNGELFRLDLEAGDMVEADRTVLARIAPNTPSILDARSLAEAEARVNAAEAAKQQAEATLHRTHEGRELARHEFERAQEMITRRAIAQAVFDEAEHQARIADADVRSAEFGLRVADFELELAQAALVRTRPLPDVLPTDATLTLLSPVSGQVLRVFRESAGVVKSGDQLLELGDPRDLEMEVDVLSVDAVRIRPGARVIVEHWGGDHHLEGQVRRIEPSAFLKISALGVEEQRVYVVADFLDPPENRQSLGDAYRIEVRIVVDEVENAVKVPSGTLFREGDVWNVFRLDKNRARLQQVEIGRSDGLETEILTGIQVGDSLILHPTDRVRDGVSIRRR